MIYICRYIPGSTKGSTRQVRAKGASRVYSLRCITALPTQKSILTVSQNKAQLIDLLCEDLVSHKEEFQRHRLVVTGKLSVPVELNKGLLIKRYDMETTQEEADTILVQQVASVKPDSALVVADDTDVFILLLHFCHNGSISSQVLMASPCKGRAVLDVNATALKHHAIIPDLLATHGLTGCDTVATYYGIGKGVALKILKTGRYPLDHVGDINSSLPDVLNQATPCILACYGQSGCHSMTEARHHMWSKKVSKSTAGAPKLKSLPPTTEAFQENVARAHFQVAVWRHSLEADPPSLEPTNNGWCKEEGSQLLCPTTVQNDVPLAPEGLLKLIKCSCSRDRPCKTQKCGCCSSGMACSLFCSCQGGQQCWNPLSMQGNEEDQEEEDDSDST